MAEEERNAEARNEPPPAERATILLVECEGVETTEERDALATLGADLLQGPLFAVPEPVFRHPSVFAGPDLADAAGLSVGQ